MKRFILLPVLLAFAMAPVAAQNDDDYELVFSDEFNLPNGSRPDPLKWKPSRRANATWNRWISDSAEVAYIKDGWLVCRAIPNPYKDTDPVDMITGAVETRDLFSFTYGKVLIRLRTNLHTGNFPAAWMMPQPPCDGWPKGGEIDIFESIDDQNTSYHTVHSHWTYDLGYRSNPQSSFSKSTTVSQWHVYGLEWTEDAITWTVDGKEVGTYTRLNTSAAKANGQWPFDHAFYIILNQSVGNGSWAKNADTHHIYNTYFDYVRVYQRRDTDAVRDLVAPSTGNGGVSLSDAKAEKVLSGNQLLIRRGSQLYTLSGALVSE